MFDAASEGFADAFDRYVDLYAPGADVEATGPDFFAEVGARLLPGLAVFTRTLRHVAHRRDRARIVRDGMDHFTVHLVRSGAVRLDADGTARALKPGEGVLVDMTRPFRSTAAGRFLILSLPRERLREAGLDPAGLHGALLAGGDGRLEALLTAGRADGNGEEVVEGVLRDLRTRAGSPPGERGARSRQERARLHIEAHLADPDLSPARIATATGMSRATLYRMFEPLGGVSDWIQARRLQCVRVLLARSALPVSEAGRRAGFANPSHLAFAFQARFGCTPSAFRQARAAARVHDGAAAAAFALADMSATLAEGPRNRAAA